MEKKKILNEIAENFRRIFLDLHIKGVKEKAEDKIDELIKDKFELRYKKASIESDKIIRNHLKKIGYNGDDKEDPLIEVSITLAIYKVYVKFTSTKEEEIDAIKKEFNFWYEEI